MSTTPTASDIIIFGATGDLAKRKLIPALYQLENASLLHPDSRVIGVAKDGLDSDSFRELMLCSLQQFIGEQSLVPEAQEQFLNRLSFCPMDFTQAQDYQALAQQLTVSGDACVFYFATPASLYQTISENLHRAGCLNHQSRVVLEKPIGHDLVSSNRINDQVAHYFSETQIYRIDHYLGKETVQNLLALRFANPLFGAQWNQNFISHIEINVAEKVGIEGRWGYFDQAGQLRDMVQNHLLQLLCLIAMDPPSDLSADMIRDEKVKVLKSLQSIAKSSSSVEWVRGRYANGYSEGQPVPGYLEEDGANLASQTETFVALKLAINNWRWAGVPFYLRTGKRMPEKLSQITVHFKPQPHFIFDEQQRALAHNKLVIRLQPDEGISLQILSKDQGLDKGMSLRSEPLKLDFGKTFHQQRTPDAYERLLLEVMQGNQYLFVRRDEVEHAWHWCDALIEKWQQENTAPLEYPAGSWGPKAADLMIMRDGKCWHEDQ